MGPMDPQAQTGLLVEALRQSLAANEAGNKATRLTNRLAPVIHVISEECLERACASIAPFCETWLLASKLALEEDAAGVAQQEATFQATQARLVSKCIKCLPNLDLGRRRHDLDRLLRLIEQALGCVETPPHPHERLEELLNELANVQNPCTDTNSKRGQARSQDSNFERLRDSLRREGKDGRRMAAASLSTLVGFTLRALQELVLHVKVERTVPEDLIVHIVLRLTRCARALVGESGAAEILSCQGVLPQLSLAAILLSEHIATLTWGSTGNGGEQIEATPHTRCIAALTNTLHLIVLLGRDDLASSLVAHSVRALWRIHGSLPAILREVSPHGTDVRKLQEWDSAAWMGTSSTVLASTLLEYRMLVDAHGLSWECGGSALYLRETESLSLAQMYPAAYHQIYQEPELLRLASCLDCLLALLLVTDLERELNTDCAGGCDEGSEYQLVAVLKSALANTGEGACLSSAKGNPNDVYESLVALLVAILKASCQGLESFRLDRWQQYILLRLLRIFVTPDDNQGTRSHTWLTGTACSLGSTIIECALQLCEHISPELQQHFLRALVSMGRISGAPCEESFCDLAMNAVLSFTVPGTQGTERLPGDSRKVVWSSLMANLGNLVQIREADEVETLKPGALMSAAIIVPCLVLFHTSSRETKKELLVSLCTQVHQSCRAMIYNVDEGRGVSARTLIVLGHLCQMLTHAMSYFEGPPQWLEEFAFRRLLARESTFCHRILAAGSQTGDVRGEAMCAVLWELPLPSPEDHHTPSTLSYDELGPVLQAGGFADHSDFVVRLSRAGSIGLLGGERAALQTDKDIAAFYSYGHAWSCLHTTARLREEPGLTVDAALDGTVSRHETETYSRSLLCAAVGLHVSGSLEMSVLASARRVLQPGHSVSEIMGCLLEIESFIQLAYWYLEGIKGKSRSRNGNDDLDSMRPWLSAVVDACAEISVIAVNACNGTTVLDLGLSSQDQDTVLTFLSAVSSDCPEAMVKGALNSVDSGLHRRFSECWSWWTYSHGEGMPTREYGFIPELSIAMAVRPAEDVAPSTTLGKSLMATVAQALGLVKRAQLCEHSLWGSVAAFGPKTRDTMLKIQFSCAARNLRKLCTDILELGLESQDGARRSNMLGLGAIVGGMHALPSEEGDNDTRVWQAMCHALCQTISKFYESAILPEVYRYSLDANTICALLTLMVARRIARHSTRISVITFMLALAGMHEAKSESGEHELPSTLKRLRSVMLNHLCSLDARTLSAWLLQQLGHHGEPSPELSDQQSHSDESLDGFALSLDFLRVLILSQSDELPEPKGVENALSMLRSLYVCTFPILVAASAEQGAHFLLYILQMAAKLEDLDHCVVYLEDTLYQALRSACGSSIPSKTSQMVKPRVPPTSCDKTRAIRVLHTVMQTFAGVSSHSTSEGDTSSTSGMVASRRREGTAKASRSVDGQPTASTRQDQAGDEKFVDASSFIGVRSNEERPQDSVMSDEEEEFVSDDDECRGDSVAGWQKTTGLANKVCTFTASGSNFMEQHWYFCYTCELTNSKGMCSVCAQVCHKGHDVVYSRYSRFFCDCGAGSVRSGSCQCLTPRKQDRTGAGLADHSIQGLFTEYPPSAPLESSQAGKQALPHPASDEHVQKAMNSLSRSESEAITVALGSIENALVFTTQELASQAIQESIPRNEALLHACTSGLASVQTEESSSLCSLRRTFRQGVAFDGKGAKLEYPSTRELKLGLADGSLCKDSVSLAACGHVGVAEGDRVTILQSEPLVGGSKSSSVGDKGSVKVLSRNNAMFEVVQLLFNPENSNYLAVAGLKDCQIFKLSSSGEVLDRVPIEVSPTSSRSSPNIRRLYWLPNSQTKLLILDSMFIRILDLAKDSLSPTHCFAVEGDTICDVTVAPSGDGGVMILAICASGQICCQPLASCTDGPELMTNFVRAPEHTIGASGAAIHYSRLGVLLLSYDKVGTVLGLLENSNQSVKALATLPMPPKEDAPTLKAGPNCVQSFFEPANCSTGLIICRSGLGTGIMAIQLHGDHSGGLKVQYHRWKLGPTSRVEGQATLRVDPDANDVSCLLLTDDGSMQVLAIDSPKPLHPSPIRTQMRSSAVKGSGKDHSQTAKEQKREDFPVTFFENTRNISSEVSLSGTFQPNDGETARHNLGSEDGYIEGPSNGASGSFRVVMQPTSNYLIVGCRIQVGSSGSGHIPVDVRMFNRTRRFQPGKKRWYDVPFTDEEVMSGDEECTLHFGHATRLALTSRVDAIEIYGRSKEDFGWTGKAAEPLTASSADAADKDVPSESLSLMTVDEAPFRHLFWDALCFWQNLGDAAAPGARLPAQSLFEILTRVEALHCLPQDIASTLAQVVAGLACAPGVHTSHGRDEHFVKEILRMVELIETFDLWPGGPQFMVAQFTLVKQIHHLGRLASCRPEALVKHTSLTPALMARLVKLIDRVVSANELSISVVYQVSFSLVSACLGLAQVSLDVNPSVGDFDKYVGLVRSLLFSSCKSLALAAAMASSTRILKGSLTLPSQAHASRSVRKDSPEPGQETADLVGDEHETEEAQIQYRCDVCFACPIQSIRWHCNQCADYDICDNCYSSGSGGFFEGGHSRDHTLTACVIPQTSADACDTSPSLRSSAARPVTVGKALHEEDTDNDECDYVSDPGVDNAGDDEHPIERLGDGSTPASDFKDQDKTHNQAASKGFEEQCLESLLQDIHLLKNRPGVEALPFLQVLYRLLTAAMGSRSLERTQDCVRRLISMLPHDTEAASDARVQTRSFQELQVLLFMFFASILRSKREKRSVGSTRTQPHVAGTSPIDGSLVKQQVARTLLKDDSLVRYLLALVRYHVPCLGKCEELTDDKTLLVEDKASYPGSTLPFFSDSYSKSNTQGLFTELPRLLLESSLRLVYQLVFSQDKRLGGSILRSSSNALCQVLELASTSSLRRFARRLLVHAYGSRTAAYECRDLYQYDREFKTAFPDVKKHSLGTWLQNLTHNQEVLLYECLSTMVDTASQRPEHWHLFCSKMDPQAGFPLEAMAQVVVHDGVSEEVVLKCLRLLRLGVSLNAIDECSKERKCTGTSQTDACAANVSMSALLETRYLERFMVNLLLEWNVAAVRQEAMEVLKALWLRCQTHDAECKRPIVSCMCKLFPASPQYGQRASEFISLFTWVLSVDGGNCVADQSLRDLLPGTSSTIMKTVKLQNELLGSHPNGRLYKWLRALVDFDGYYLESEPCLTCSNPEESYSPIKLDSMKSEAKFTDKRIIVRCSDTFSLKSFSLNLHDLRPSKCIKSFSLFYCNKRGAELADLKNQPSLWKHACCCCLSYMQSELQVDFKIPIEASYLMVQFDSFHESAQAKSMETLQCPRCSRFVTDRHGICKNCQENAFQCRQCRNINYENLDAFLCNECGYSKYARFDMTFMARVSFHYEGVTSESEVSQVLSNIETESENAHRKYQQLLAFRKPLLALLNSLGESDSDQREIVKQLLVAFTGSGSKNVCRGINVVGWVYGEKCKAAFEGLTRSVRTLIGLRQSLRHHLFATSAGAATSTGDMESCEWLLAGCRCFGCASTFVVKSMELLCEMVGHQSLREQLLDENAVEELFHNSLHQGSRAFRGQSRKVLCALSSENHNVSVLVDRLLKAKIEGCLHLSRSIDVATAVREEMELLEDLCRLPGNWEDRLRLCFEIMFVAISTVGAENSQVADAVLLPCMQIINENIRGTTSRLGKSASREVQEVADESVPLVKYSNWKLQNGTEARDSSFADFRRRRRILSPSSRESPEGKAMVLALRYGLRWRWRRASGGLASALASPSWISSLLLSRSSPSLRTEAVSMIEMILQTKNSSSRSLSLLDLLASQMADAVEAGACAKEFFDLYGKLTDDVSMRIYLTVRGHLMDLVSLLGKEASRIKKREQVQSADISQGYTLKKLVEILMNALSVVTLRRYFVRHSLLIGVMRAYFVVRSLVVQKTKLLKDCVTLLRSCLQTIQDEGESCKQEYIQAGVSLLQEWTESSSMQALILEDLCSLICPVKPEPDYQLVLQKAPTQEEFIRGNLTRNPYSSSEIGPTMRDVKNRVCKELELHGLLDDDLGMELLVAGHIIALDLPVSLVYEQFWCKALSRAGAGTGPKSPMHVTYRLQGLDGEATEPVVDSLHGSENETVDPEIEFRIASVMATCGGLVEMMRLLENLSGRHANKEEHLLRLLLHCTKLKCNREALLEQGALPQILAKTTGALSSEALMSSAETLLLILEAVVIEAISTQQDEGLNGGHDILSMAGVDAKSLIRLFLSKLAAPVAKLSDRNTEALARLLPFLTFGDSAAMAALVDHFRSDTQFHDADRSIDKEVNHEERLRLECLVHVVDSISLDHRGEKLRSLFLEAALPYKACSYLLSVFPAGDEPILSRSSEDWSKALELPGVFYALRILKGLARHHEETQLAIGQSGAMRLLHSLECSTSERGIGALAEELLDVLGVAAEGGILLSDVESMRSATKEEAKRRAAAQREQMLREMGLERTTAASGEVKIVAGAQKLKSIAAFEGLDSEDEDEERLSCVICREGYRLRPREPLGVYCYCMRVRDATSGTGKFQNYCSSVSHFTPIHFDCHRAAKRADASLKTPKKEWEGAAIRNNETLCNNLLPLNSTELPESEYAQCAQLWWDNVSSLGHMDKARHELLFNDMRHLLSLFATNGSFSLHSHGGGKESNASLIPALLQMGQYLMDQLDKPQRDELRASMHDVLESDRSGSSQLVEYTCVLSIFTLSQREWVDARPKLLRRAIHHYFNEEGTGITGSGSFPSASEAFERCRPVFIFVGIVNYFQARLKPMEDGGAWVDLMRMTLGDINTLLEKQTDFLEWLNDMQASGDAQEALDIMGALSDALDGHSSCDEFLLEAIAAVV